MGFQIIHGNRLVMKGFYLLFLLRMNDMKYPKEMCAVDLSSMDPKALDFSKIKKNRNKKNMGLHSLLFYS